MELRKEFVVPLNEQKLPLYTETIGYNPDQEKVVRPNGYPHYHWLQSIGGDGTIYYMNESFTLSANEGVLLLPGEPHSYECDKQHHENWETVYLTFDGLVVKDILASLKFFQTTRYSWEPHSPLQSYIRNSLNNAKTEQNTGSIQTSTLVYEFLLTLKKYGRRQNHSSSIDDFHRMEKTVAWMTENIANPDANLEDMAALLCLSKRRITSLFRHTYDVTPYSFFINLRIKKAKSILLESKTITIKDITREVGFRSPSHFIATFRKMTGLTPDQYRQLH